MAWLRNLREWLGMSSKQLSADSNPTISTETQWRLSNIHFIGGSFASF